MPGATIMSTLHEEANDLIETFTMFDEWEDRYRFLIDLGKDLPLFPDEARTDENKVHGCQSNVWMIAAPRENNGETIIDFLADSDAHIVRGLIAILHRVYSGRSADEILSFDAEAMFRQLGLDQHLSMGRRNGLAGMVARIRTLAAQLTNPNVGILQ
jgi:cysteine desulfuration protein SufE